MKKVELLAPAGSYEGLIAVIKAGADAVYLSGKKFGARAYASNFDNEELIKAIKTSHLFNVKVYLTLNTLIKESEFNQIYDYLAPLVECKLDGVIVQDLGVVGYILREFPSLPVHLSTQMSICSSSSLSVFKNLNVTRVVPARELSLDEIRSIKEESGIEIECFIHGAMCYSYSGKCLFSAVVGQRSGNRGRCAQPCRLPYSLPNENQCYPLSLKDMNTIHVLDKLIEAGVDSFKIEGRMKRSEYAAGVTSIYRKYIDLYYENGNYEIDSKDLDILDNLYVRKETCEGYLNKHNGKDMITFDSPAYKATSEDLLNKINDTYIKSSLALKIDAKVKFIKGEPFVIEYSYNNQKSIAKGMIVDTAKKAPVSYDKIKEQVSKLGDTYFELRNINIECDTDGFLPIGAINEVRREAINKLEDIILELY